MTHMVVDSGSDKVYLRTGDGHKAVEMKQRLTASGKYPLIVSGACAWDGEHWSVPRFEKKQPEQIGLGAFGRQAR